MTKQHQFDESIEEIITAVDDWASKFKFALKFSSEIGECPSEDQIQKRDRLLGEAAEKFVLMDVAMKRCEEKFSALEPEK